MQRDPKGCRGILKAEEGSLSSDSIPKVSFGCIRNPRHVEKFKTIQRDPKGTRRIPGVRGLHIVRRDP